MRYGWIPTVSQDEIPTSVGNEFRNDTNLIIQNTKMALLNIYESKVSNEFKNFLDQIKTNIEAYNDAKQKAQKERMIIIGKISK